MRKIAIKDIRKQDYFYTEAIKTLRTNIQLSGKSIKTIMVTVAAFRMRGRAILSLSIATGVKQYWQESAYYRRRYP